MSTKLNLDDIKDLARRGNKDAQYKLATLYKEGKQIDKNLNSYKKWLEDASKSGSKEATYELGECYANGIAVNQDEKTALNLYKKAAELGSSDAKYKIAILLLNGLTSIIEEENYDNDLVSAEANLRSAANESHVDAQYQLALLYKMDIKGLKVDYTECLRWLKKASESGHLDAQNTLGYLYAYGSPDGKIKKNAELAMKWWKAAAEKLHPEAQYNLAVSYATEAINNWKRSAKSGNEKSKYMLERISSFEWDDESD